MDKIHRQSSIALSLLVVPFYFVAQESKVFESLSFSSSILKKEKRFSIYLPPGYEVSRRSYPVVYLLHGGDGDHTDWIQKGNMQSIVDHGIKEGNINQSLMEIFHLMSGKFSYLYRNYNFPDGKQRFNTLQIQAS